MPAMIRHEEPSAPKPSVRALEIGSKLALAVILMGLPLEGCVGTLDTADGGRSLERDASTSVTDGGTASTRDGAMVRVDGGDNPPANDAGGPDASSSPTVDAGPLPGNDAGSIDDTTPSPGCGASAAAGFTCMDIDFEGATRRWCMNIPDSYDAMHAYDLILGLHGCGGNASNVHRHRANMEAYGESDFLFAYPQATGSCWDYGGGNDLAFIEHVIATITSTYCVDAGSVFVHGMSSGGSMSSVIASRGTIVRAYASVSAGGSGGRMPAWYYGGRSDSYYASNIIPGRDARVSGNGCDGTTTPIAGTPCVRYNGCDHAVTYCEDDRGHVWPGEEWAQAGMIDFFRAVP